VARLPGRYGTSDLDDKNAEEAEKVRERTKELNPSRGTKSRDPELAAHQAESQQLNKDYPKLKVTDTSGFHLLALRCLCCSQPFKAMRQRDFCNGACLKKGLHPALLNEAIADRKAQEARREAELALCQTEIARTTAVCAQCGTPFQRQRSTAKFCSDACKQNAYRKRVVTLKAA
jgi:hypothetical protein